MPIDFQMRRECARRPRVQPNKSSVPDVSLLLGQVLDADVAEDDGVAVASEAEVALGAVHAFVRLASHELFHVLEIAIEDHRAVEHDFDG